MSKKKDYRDLSSEERVRKFHAAICSAFKLELEFSKVRKPLEVIFIFRKVQGELDKKGDEFLNAAVEQISSTGFISALKNQDKVNVKELMRSNFFLERIYHRLGLPNLSTFFDQERNRRNFKVHASMMEFVIGLILEVKGPEFTMDILRSIVYPEIISSLGTDQINILREEMKKYNRVGKLPFK